MPLDSNFRVSLFSFLKLCRLQWRFCGSRHASKSFPFWQCWGLETDDGIFQSFLCQKTDSRTIARHQKFTLTVGIFLWKTLTSQNLYNGLVNSVNYSHFTMSLILPMVLSFLFTLTFSPWKLLLINNRCLFAPFCIFSKFSLQFSWLYLDPKPLNYLYWVEASVLSHSPVINQLSSFSSRFCSWKFSCCEFAYIWRWISNLSYDFLIQRELIANIGNKYMSLSWFCLLQISQYKYIFYLIELCYTMAIINVSLIHSLHTYYKNRLFAFFSS